MSEEGARARRELALLFRAGPSCQLLGLVPRGRESSGPTGRVWQRGAHAAVHADLQYPEFSCDFSEAPELGARRPPRPSDFGQAHVKVNRGWKGTAQADDLQDTGNWYFQYGSRETPGSTYVDMPQTAHEIASVRQSEAVSEGLSQAPRPDPEMGSGKIPRTWRKGTRQLLPDPTGCPGTGWLSTQLTDATSVSSFVARAECHFLLQGAPETHCTPARLNVPVTVSPRFQRAQDVG
ncbi:hypothetical protein TREES_T100017621 [Tupaia chinensis]|uniref:Uncharacterized protein n=1 Tax=Tupaia chinensis TaxID=246437 RepID=L9L402_TUPCH|nr:hypothetical protein TREES_T100017621 [Tupaia chinensis]